MDFINQFLKTALSPLGMGIILVGGYFILTTKPSQRPLHWLLFSLCAFTATLSEFRDEFVKDSPPLAFPLEQLRTVGRPLTMLLLLLLLVLAFRTKPGWRRVKVPKPLQMLILLQGVLILKIFLEGDLTFGLLSVVTYSAAIAMVIWGPGRWLQDDRNFHLGIGAIALVSALFVGASLYQASIDPYPITFVHGLLMGTAGNPQHAATLLVTTVPALLFLLLFPEQPIWRRVLWLGLLLSVLVALLLTGSRTGFISALVGITVFFSQRLNIIQKLGALIALGFAFIFSNTASSVAIGALTSLGPDKLTSVENTRAIVWQAQWMSFNTHPLFGAPLNGGRLGFGENSWLAVAAAVGIVGLIPLGLFAYQLLKFMRKVYQISIRNEKYRLHCNTIIAGLVILLVGSIAEAYLLGLITFPLIALSLYLVLGQYLIDTVQYENTLQRSYHFLEH